MTQANNHSGMGEMTLSQRLQRWVDNPLSQVIAATGATIGSFGLVLGGIGAIHLAMQ